MVAALVLKHRGLRAGDPRARVLLAERRCQGLGFKACVEERRTEYVTLLDSTLYSKLSAVLYLARLLSILCG